MFNLYFDFINNNGINWLEIVITGLFTFLAVFLAYKLENDRLKQERKIIFIHLLKSFKHEIEGNLEQLDKAFENRNKNPWHVKEIIHTANFPFSLEITKSFLNNTINYEFLSENAIKEIWNLLNKMRLINRHEKIPGFTGHEKITDAIKSINDINNKIELKIKDLENGS